MNSGARWFSWIGIAALGVSGVGLGCASSSHSPGVSATGGASASGGSAGSAVISGGAAGSAGAANGAGVAGSIAELCPESVTPARTTGGVLELPLQLLLGNQPFVFGQENALAGGASLVPLDLRFFISGVSLLRADSAQPIPVDIVTAAGTPAPYGVYFFNAEDPSASALRVLAPPGTYVGLSFRLGLDSACNTRDPGTSDPPLSPTSQMTWPHTGYLFLRFEGRYSSGAGGGGGSAGLPSSNSGGGASGSPSGGNSGTSSGSGGGASGAATGGTAGASATVPTAPPEKVHMGGSLFEDLAPRVMVLGMFTVPATGTVQEHLELDMAQIFKGAETEADLTGFTGPPGEEVVFGEQLRQTLPSLHAFVLKP